LHAPVANVDAQIIHTFHSDTTEEGERDNGDANEGATD
jgi:hypothetical protein